MTTNGSVTNGKMLDASGKSGHMVLPKRNSPLHNLILAVVFGIMSGLASTVSADIVYVAPGGTGNGSSWNNACGDLKTAYELLGSEGGELWVKKGLYILTNEITIAANIAVYGGFNGTETERSQANPAANMTLISGDRDKDDVFMTGSSRAWRYNTYTPIWDYETLSFNRPVPSNTEDSRSFYYFWTPWPNSNGTGFAANNDAMQSALDSRNDTPCAFRHQGTDGAIGLAHFEGLTFSGFKTNVICVAGQAESASPRESELSIRNCRFLGCVNGASSSKTGYFSAVSVTDMPATIADSTFDRTLHPVMLRAPGLLLDEEALVVSNCTFTYSTCEAMTIVDVSAAGHPTPATSTRLRIVDCRFDHNTRLSGGAAGVSAKINGIVERCLFEDNLSRVNGTGLVLIYGGNSANCAMIEIRDCRFLRNRTLSTSSGSAICIASGNRDATFVSQNARYPIIRNCYFAENEMRITGHTNNKNAVNADYGICYLQNGCHGNLSSISTILINCTSVSNKFEYAGTSDSVATTGHFATFYGNNILVNCVVKDTQFVNSSAFTGEAAPVFYDFRSCCGKDPTFINTVAMNADPYANYHFTAGSFFIYNSIGTGHDDMTGVTLSRLKTNNRGTPFIRVETYPNARPGRPVWEVGYDIAVYDPDYNSKKPWRTFWDYRKDYSGCNASVTEIPSLTVEDTEHLVRDINGDARRPKGDAYGPLRYYSGMTMMFR